MAQQAPLEPGSALYEFAQTVDVSKLPEKLRCKSCDRFLLNAYKTACCEDGICEPCTTAAAGSACPICKHSPLVTNTGKALRGTARNYLKNQMAEANKATESTPSVAPPESKETSVAAQDEPRKPLANGKSVGDDHEQELAEPAQEPQNENEQSDDIVQSIETQREGSRRPTIVSTSGNEPDDDDIEINVGLGEYEFTQVADGSNQTPVDEAEQWPGEQTYDKTRKNSTIHTQSQIQNPNQSFHGNAPFNDFDNSGMNQNMNNMSNDPQFWEMMQSGGMNNMNPMFAMMQNQPMMQQMMQQMQSMQANGMMQNFPAGMQYMQSMGMMPQMGMNGQNQNWPGNMMNMMNSNFNSMMNNGASFNSNQQQYQQNYQNGDYRFNRNGSFDRGRGRGRGRNKFRGGFNNQFSHQDQFASFNNMPFQSHLNQGSMQNQQNQYDNNSHGNYPANHNKENIEHAADDDEFAPGGQDEVQEALGDSYNNKQQSVSPEEVKTEEAPIEETKQEEYQREPSPATVEETPVYESPKPEPKETYIPEAYREDLDFPSAPPTAPLGPSSKDVPYRARGGHGRFPSRGRGSFQGSVGFPPRSPARPVSQHQTNSPPTNQGSGVVGAPTGPRAMREKDAPPPKTLSRSESDVGFKIRGTATQATEQRAREEQQKPRNATPQSAYEDHDDREKDSSRRHSKYDRKYESSRYRESTDDYDDRDRRRRKSRREDDYDEDMQDAEHSRSDSQDRSTTHRSGRKDKDRTRDRYSSGASKHKSSSRKYDDEYEDGRDDGNDYGDEVNSRSKSKKSSSKYEDRDERRDRDYERAEKDKHRKRSRHDRDRDDEIEDADEEESRRRSRRHKKEHRKDKDRDAENSTDLGMRITGRSSNHRTSEMTTPNSNTPALSDKDPHTLEREARDRERMQKEQQRRQNAIANQKGLSGGRTRSFKYEDEIERSMNKPSRRR